MLKTFVLIMVITQGYPEGALTTLNVNFDDETSCRKALMDIQTKVNRSPENTTLISAGCYQVGEPK